MTIILIITINVYMSLIGTSEQSQHAKQRCITALYCLLCLCCFICTCNQVKTFNFPPNIDSSFTVLKANRRLLTAIFTLLLI